MLCQRRSLQEHYLGQGQRYPPALAALQTPGAMGAVKEQLVPSAVLRPGSKRLVQSKMPGAWDWSAALRALLTLPGAAVHRVSLVSHRA